MRLPGIVRSAACLTTTTLLLSGCTELSAPGDSSEDVAGAARALVTTPGKKACDPEDPDFDPSDPCIWSNGWDDRWPNGYPKEKQQGWQKPWRNLWVLGSGQTGLTNSWAVAWSDVFGGQWDTDWNFDANVDVWVHSKGGTTVGPCAHPVTQRGDALGGCSSTHAIVEKVCDELVSCCDATVPGAWDDACVAKAVEIAARHIPGSRSVLVPGGPMVAWHHVVAGGADTVGGSDTVVTDGGGSSGGGGKGTIIGGAGGSTGTVSGGTSGGSTAGGAGTIISNPSTGTVSGGFSGGFSGTLSGGLSGGTSAGTLIDGVGGSTGTVTEGGGTTGGKGGIETVDPSTGEVFQDGDQPEVLGTGSNACVAQVCKTEGYDYCCETAWDDACVEKAIQLCSTQYLTRTRIEDNRVVVDACIEPKISGFASCPLDATRTEGEECCRQALVLNGVYTVTDTEELTDEQGGGLGRIVNWSKFVPLTYKLRGMHVLRGTFIPSPCHTLASGTRECEWTEEHKLWLMASPVVGTIQPDCSGPEPTARVQCNCDTPYDEMCADAGHQGVGMRGLLLAAASALITTNGLHEIDIRWAFGTGNAPFMTSMQQVLAMLMPREAHWYAEKVASTDPANATYRARASCYSPHSPQRAEQDMVRQVLDCPDVQPNPNPEMLMLMDSGNVAHPAIYSFYGDLLLSPN